VTVSLCLLSLVMLLEALVFFGMSGDATVLIVLVSTLILFAVCQVRWPARTQAFQPAIAVLLLCTMLALQDGQAGSVMLYVLFMHGVAWMLGVASCCPKPETAVTPLILDARTSWLYTEAYWLVVLPAYYAIDRNLSTVPYLPGLVTGMLILVLGFFLWEATRKVISLPIRGAAGEFPARALSVYVLLLSLLGLALLIATPVSRAIPEAVDYGRIKVEDWIEQRRLSQLGNQPQAPSQAKTPSKPSGQGASPEQESGFTMFPELPERSSLGDVHREDVFLHVHNRDALRRIGPGRLYLRGLSFAHYQDDRWFPRRIVGTWHNDIDDGEPDGLIRISPSRANPVVQTVFLNQAGSRVLFAMPGLEAVHLPRLYEAADRCYMFPDSETLKVSYTVRSTPWFFDQVPGGDVRVSTVSQEYYEIPNLPVMARIAGLAQQVAPPTLGLADRIEACRTYLKDNYTYSREITNSSSLPPLENFLFHERRGYCDFYASSLVFMLRSLGMPARMSGGYAGGVYDAASDVQIFYSDHAHSWTEIPIEGYGWVVLDATAEGVVIPRSQEPAPPTTASLDDFEHISPEVREPEAEAAGGGEMRKAFASFQQVQVYLFGGILLLLVGVLLVALVRFLSGRQAERIQHRSEDELPELGFYAEVCRLFRSAGQGRKPSQTPREFLKRLRGVGYHEEILETLTDYVYAVSYRGEPRNSIREETFVDAARRIIKAREQRN
jgi:transglutaminase-like putative cysteine protease